MPTCVICLNSLRTPAALPCGHVFCYDCIVKVVRNVQPFTQQHYCPTCRSPYTIASLDSTLVPTHLRPHLTPAIRKLCLDYTSTNAASDSSPVAESDRLRSENASLRACCEIWRKRAAVHAAASLGLVGLARLTRDEVLKIKKEKAELEMRYGALKRQYAPNFPEPEISHSYLPSPPEIHDILQKALPITRAISVSDYRSASPCDSEHSYCSDCEDCQPTLKRRRLSTLESDLGTPDAEFKQSPGSASPVLPPTPPC